MMPALWSLGPLTAYVGISVHAGSVQNGEISGTGERLEPGATHAGLKAMRGVH